MDGRIQGNGETPASLAGNILFFKKPQLPQSKHDWVKEISHPRSSPVGVDQYSADLLWHHLLQAQRLAPDNLAVNCLVYERWPDSLSEAWLVDAITQCGRLMNRTALRVHIAELDHSNIKMMLSIVEMMAEGDQIIMRVQHAQPVATLKGESRRVENTCAIDAGRPVSWRSCRMTRKDLLILLLKYETDCAEAYRLLGRTLDNPFERVSWISNGIQCSFNRAGLYEQATKIEEAS